MIAPTTDNDPLRCAALTLHALSEEDRGWLLASLPQGDAERMAPLLEELASLGIPRDRALVPLAGERPQEAAQWPLALDARAQDALLRVLAREPQGVARQLLSLQAWNWTPAVAAGLAAVGWERPAGGVRPHGARFEAALLDALKKHADAQPERALAPPAANLWQRARWLLGRRRDAP